MRFFHGRQLQPREFVNLGDEDEGTAQGRVLSVYPATEGLSFKVIRGIIDAHLDALLPLVTEYLPREVLRERRACRRIGDALRMVHRPASLAEAMEGRARLAFEELLFVQLLQQRAKALARETRRGIAFENRRELTTQLREALPFQLTGAQVRVLREIFADMCSERRMQRLLQGDVGSGKTIVALFAALLAMENGYQAAIMAPTELLAEQHCARMTTHARAARHRADARSPAACTAKARARRSRRASPRRRRRSSSARTRSCRRPPRSPGSASPSSTSSTASAWSSARRSAPRARRPTCCS